jgi:hypothetical protein
MGMMVVLHEKHKKEQNCLHTDIRQQCQLRIRTLESQS